MIVVVGGLWLVASPAFAQTPSLKSLKRQAGDEQALQSEVDYTNQVCDSRISASVDWGSFERTDPAAGPAPVPSCDAALSAIENLCKDETSKEAVRSQVQEVVCTKGEAREVTLKQGTLWFQLNGPTGDDFQYVREYLTRRFASNETDEPE